MVNSDNYHGSSALNMFCFYFQDGGQGEFFLYSLSFNVFFQEIQAMTPSTWHQNDVVQTSVVLTSI